MYYIQNPLSNRDAALDEITRRYGYEYQRRKYVETYPYINSVYGSNDIRIRELVERYGVNGTPYIPNPKTISIGNITSNGIILPQDLNSGIARLSAVRGKSLVWNQLVKDYSQSGNLKATGSSTIRYEDGKIKISITEAGSNNAVGIATGQFIAGHKVACLVEYAGTMPSIAKFGSWVSVGASGSTSSSLRKSIRSLLTTSYDNGCLWLWGESTDFEISTLNIIDLTLMFGEGHEPATVEEFEAMYPLPYYDYNTGTIINNSASGIKTVGFNQFDKGEVKEGYSLYDESGLEARAPSSWCSGWIPVLPNVVYYVSHVIAKIYGYAVHFYDKEKNHLYGIGISGSTYDESGTVTTPANAAFARLRSTLQVGYQEVSFNFSNFALNGTYKPYKKDTLTLNLSTIKGKLNGDGESVTIFPDGMRSAGTAYDYLIVDADGYARKAVKVIGSVDMGTLNYTKAAVSSSYPYGYFSALVAGRSSSNRNILSAKYPTVPAWNVDKVVRGTSSNATIYVIDSAYAESDAATFKSAMSGVELIYELATPQEYVLDEPIYTFFEVEKGGMLRAEYNDSEQVHAPLDVDLIYSEAK